MSHTSDNEKKARDNNALLQKKNKLKEKNSEAGQHQFSKKTDHL